MNSSDVNKILEEHNLTREELEKLNKDPEETARELKLFEEGIEPVKLEKPAVEGDGIVLLKEDEYDELFRLQKEAADKGEFISFVPASGAASRMFSKLQSVLNTHGRVTQKVLEKTEDEDPASDFTLTFIENIDRFAFRDELAESLYKTDMVMDDLLKKGEYTEIIAFTTGEEGLNYSNKPKGLVLFHRYPGSEPRTAFEEHLHETALYGLDKGGRGKLHFTIPLESTNEIAALFNRARSRFVKDNVDFDISFSNQKDSTDTIAVDFDNNPLRDEEGNPVFRPGGHGALLQNLNDLNADMVYIKNVDNVVPDHLRDTTVKYRKLLGGYLVKTRKKVFDAIERLEKDGLTEEELFEIGDMAEEDLNIHLPDDYDKRDNQSKKDYLLGKLERPIRVAGMVENTGDPGGGPFWIEEDDGCLSLQIVETSQINLDNSAQRDIFESSTHFNPVDIVCSLRDRKGKPYNLADHVDPSTAFITKKTKNGKELKALEHPGLWNGSMADWITVFVEIPAITFTPVKEVNDLLKKEHQPPEN